MAKIDTTKAAAQAVAEKLARGKQNSASSANPTSANSATIPAQSVSYFRSAKPSRNSPYCYSKPI